MEYKRVSKQTIIDYWSSVKEIIDSVWQAKEMIRALEVNSLPESFDIMLFQHISPLGWTNIINLWEVYRR